MSENVGNRPTCEHVTGGGWPHTPEVCGEAATHYYRSVVDGRRVNVCEEHTRGIETRVQRIAA